MHPLAPPKQMRGCILCHRIDLRNQVLERYSTKCSENICLRLQLNYASSDEKLDEEYIKYIMSKNSSVKRDEVVAFLSVLNIYNKTGDKKIALDAFDAFIRPIATGDLLHATMVCGLFCGLLGPNMSLSNEEVTSLSEKYHALIEQQIMERGGIFN